MYEQTREVLDTIEREADTLGKDYPRRFRRVTMAPQKQLGLS